MSAGRRGLRLEDLAQDRDALFCERVIPAALAVYEPPARQQVLLAVGRTLADGELFGNRRRAGGPQLGDQEEDFLLPGGEFRPAGRFSGWRGRPGARRADRERNDGAPGEVVVDDNRAAQEGQLLLGHG